MIVGEKKYHLQEKVLAYANCRAYYQGEFVGKGAEL